MEAGGKKGTGNCGSRRKYRKGGGMVVRKNEGSRSNGSQRNIGSGSDGEQEEIYKAAGMEARKNKESRRDGGTRK
jgi:hypothetical protein